MHVALKWIQLSDNDMHPVRVLQRPLRIQLDVLSCRAPDAQRGLSRMEAQAVSAWRSAPGNQRSSMAPNFSGEIGLDM